MLHMTAQKQLNLIGLCRKPHGIRGEVKVESYTTPITNILNYTPWLLANGDVLDIESARAVPGGLLVKIKNMDRIEDVEHLRHAELYTSYPFISSEDSGYYWKDLIGLQVFDREDTLIGTIDGLTEAHPFDLIIILKEKRHYYIPCDMEKVIQSIDLTQGIMKIHWHAEDFND